MSSFLCNFPSKMRIEAASCGERHEEPDWISRNDRLPVAGRSREGAGTPDGIQRVARHRPVDIAVRVPPSRLVSIAMTDLPAFRRVGKHRAGDSSGDTSGRGWYGKSAPRLRSSAG